MHRVEADLGYHRFIGARIELDARRTLLVALYGSSLSEFDPQTDTLLADTLPHLAQSLTLGEDFSEMAQLQQLCGGALDAVAFGLVICTPEGMVRFANRAATKAMDGSHLLIAGDLLHVENRQDRVRLDQLLAGSSGPKTMTMRFGLGDRALDVVAFSDQKLAGARILLVSRPSALHSMSYDALCQIYGMTPAEAALATALATGQSIAEFAENRGVSISTVRTQMRQVLAKTGTKGQPDLVRQIWTSAIAACYRLTS
ncbi:DNA-binding CsgD family transcriptional regulator [Novosphingobium hassiacum]|uniref:DNA-binding CsgD family transcriptional regulator n=1 Tax=Novosphingobium hassiacum TaxID=173676 RepID=A0A7W6EUQ8_9SPHN|nr:hypothetical protein [Novosphingobium hassiacum]MBB3859518.1 DNA-binding CsgD family transcriptional regulator [Novosphingobium hassiacum]